MLLKTKKMLFKGMFDEVAEAGLEPATSRL